MTGENLVFNPRRLALVGVAAVGLTLAASAPVKAQVRYDPAYDTPYTTEEIVVTPTPKNIEITKYLILWAAGL